MRCGSFSRTHMLSSLCIFLDSIIIIVIIILYLYIKNDLFVLVFIKSTFFLKFSDSYWILRILLLNFNFDGTHNVYSNNIMTLLKNLIAKCLESLTPAEERYSLAADHKSQCIFLVVCCHTSTFLDWIGYTFHYCTHSHTDRLTLCWQIANITTKYNRFRILKKKGPITILYYCILYTYFLGAKLKLYIFPSLSQVC